MTRTDLIPQSGVSRHVNGQGSIAPFERSTEDLASYKRCRELRRFHPHNLADDSEEPLSAHAAGEPLDEGREAEKVTIDGFAVFFASCAALAVIAASWAWFVILPALGILWLAGAL